MRSLPDQDDRALTLFLPEIVIQRSIEVEFLPADRKNAAPITLSSGNEVDALWCFAVCHADRGLARVNNDDRNANE